MKKSMFRLLVLAMAMSGLTALAAGQTVNRTVTYFSVDGNSLEEIEDGFSQRGPQLDNQGPRHPGATRLEFTTRVTYGEGSGQCSIVDAEVSVNANMILPRWRMQSDADEGVKLIWDTLASDIRRHEEGHIVIARNHAREMTNELREVVNQPSCEAAAERAQEINARIMARHEREQLRFDRIESVNFESRMLRLLRYRIERIENGTLTP